MICIFIVRDVDLEVRLYFEQTSIMENIIISANTVCLSLVEFISGVKDCFFLNILCTEHQVSYQS